MGKFGQTYNRGPHHRVTQDSRAILAMTSSDIDRFWSKVDKSSGPDACWLWVAGVYKDGYGSFWTSGRNCRAHRIAYELAFGEIPDDLPDAPYLRVFVCHRCDTPLCCNPAHLWLGTVADNNQDAMRKGRSASGDKNGARKYPERLARGEANGSYTHPERRPRGDANGSRLHPERRPRGEAHDKAKMTDADVRAIRREYAEGATRAELARKFCVNGSTITRIVRRETWAHV